MDGDHDLVQASVDFFACPRQAHAVLRHFQSEVATPPALEALAGP